jgi:hypothetical protein
MILRIAIPLFSKIGEGEKNEIIRLLINKEIS